MLKVAINRCCNALIAIDIILCVIEIVSFDLFKWRSVGLVPDPTHHVGRPFAKCNGTKEKGVPAVSIMKYKLGNLCWT